MTNSSPIVLIAAVARNGVIGDGAAIPWHLPEDLKHFKATTLDQPIIMGRKTFESLGSKPLPNRTNIVISRSYPTFEEDENFTVRTRLVRVNSISRALQQGRIRCAPGQAIYVIGGGEIYNQTIDQADRLIISHVDLEAEGNTTFPVINLEVFEQGLIQPYANIAIPFTVVTYTRYGAIEYSSHG